MYCSGRRHIGYVYPKIELPYHCILDYLGSMLKYLLFLLTLAILSCDASDNESAFIDSADSSGSFRYSDSLSLFSIEIPGPNWRPERVLDEYTPSEENSFRDFHSSILFGTDSLKDNYIHILNAGVIRHQEGTLDDSILEKEVENLNSIVNVVESGELKLNGETYLYFYVQSKESPELEVDPDSAEFAELEMYLYRFNAEQNIAWSLVIATFKSDSKPSPYKELKAELERLLPILETLEMTTSAE